MFPDPRRSSQSDFDGATAVGDNLSVAAGSKGQHPLPKGYAVPEIHGPKVPMRAVPQAAPAEALPFVDAGSYLDTKRPLLVPIGKDGVIGALTRLNDELLAAGHSSLLSDKRPHQIIGREVNPGSFGLYEYASGPKILLQPGRYPRTPVQNWIGCSWLGRYDLATNFPPLKAASDGLLVPDPTLSKLGLTIVQVSQNQAAVCLDPQMQVFVVADGGFVAMATAGAYRVLGLVDKTHLRDKIIDPHSKAVLGHTQHVRLPSGYVAATFLDVPANNVAVLQRKNELYLLTAGQHYLTTAAVTVRALFTLSEVQQELEASNIYTRDSVPVYLRLYIRYQLHEPLALARHGYPTPFDALQDKTRSILTQIIAHLDYSSMARTRTAAPDGIAHLPDEMDEDVGAVFVTAVRTQAIDELKVAAAEYGIQLEDLAIIDRKFKGEIAAKLDSLTTRALEAQVESANLDRENANKRRKQEGEARVLELQNAMKRATAETEAANKIQAAKAWAEAHMIEADAQAKATRVKADADAEAVRMQARADAEIQDEFARTLAANRVEVARTKAYGNNAVFAPLEALNNGGMLAMGLARSNTLAAPGRK